MPALLMCDIKELETAELLVRLAFSDLFPTYVWTALNRRGDKATTKLTYAVEIHGGQR